MDLCGLCGAFSRVMGDTGGQFENPFASPQSEEAVVIGLDTIPAWRDGELVVVAGSGILPWCCAKCGSESVGVIHATTLASTTKSSLIQRLIPFIVLLLVPLAIAAIFATLGRLSQLGFLPELGAVPIVVLMVILMVLGAVLVLSLVPRRTYFQVAFGYCGRHQRIARLRKFIGLAITGLYLFGGWMTSGMGLILGLPLFLVIAFCSQFVYSRLLVVPRLQRREDDLCWLKGFGKPFVDSLPPYEESAEASSAANAKS